MPKRSKDTYAILGSTDPVSTRLDGGVASECKSTREMMKLYDMNFKTLCKRNTQICSTSQRTYSYILKLGH